MKYLTYGILFLSITSEVTSDDTNWSSWTQWTQCSKTCKQGMQLRVRYCYAGLPGTPDCEGAWWQSRSCVISYYCGYPTTTAITTTTTIVPTTTTTATGSCFDSGDRESYRGAIHQTKSGIICQAWNSQSPHRHRYTSSTYPNSGLNGNNCRNPDLDKNPWCFTTSSYKQWEYCDVPNCSDTTSTTTVAPGSTAPPPTSSSECGVPDVPMSDSKGNTSHIVGGVETTPGSIPWQASLRRSFSGSHFCGASLLNRNWIITAAHCITEPHNPSSYYALLGDHNQYTTDVTEKRVDFSAIFRHQQYSSSTLENDITMMKITYPVMFDTYIRPICLPNANSILPENEMVTVSGWGTTKNTGSNTVLRRASVPVVETTSCNGLIGGVMSSMMCAGYMSGGKDSCQGDSGGPLFWEASSGEYHLVGIVSWGYGCAEARKPGVYTRVSFYIPWIQNTMQN
ncbi:plasminogen-like [Styela clava]